VESTVKATSGARSGRKNSRLPSLFLAPCKAARVPLHYHFRCMYAGRPAAGFPLEVPAPISDNANNKLPSCTTSSSVDPSSPRASSTSAVWRKWSRKRTCAG
jgi:hypothetical protein